MNNTNMPIHLTVFTKSGGLLTKRISLNGDGSLKSDGSGCVMANGQARRVQVAGVDDLASLIDRLRSDQAIGLGTLRSDLADEVEIVTKSKLNGEKRPNLIARTGSDIVYEKGQPAFILLDFDSKGMPPEVRAQLNARGGFWDALVAVLPALGNVARVIRRSTSAGLRRTDTGEQLKGSDGLHVYVIVHDGTDAERFLTTLHQRCWLRGLGWMMVGVAGQLLERSIVDRMVGRPERLVFEGPPVVEPPLAQDEASRKPMFFDGGMLDTRIACPPLTPAEQQELRKLLGEAKQRSEPEARKARGVYINDRASELAERTGISVEEARRTVESQVQGILLPAVVLPFDDPQLAGCTVGDVLNDPARFEGRTLADPIEGVAYGRCKAKILLHADGTPWIHSFAHGRTLYALRRVPDGEFTPEQVDEIARLAAMNRIEYDQARAAAAEALGIRVTTLDAVVAQHRAQPEEGAALQGTALTLAPPDPWPQPVDGPQLVAALEEAIRRHVVLSEPQALAVALWMVHSHAQHAAEHFPRLHLAGPAKRCGKTTLLRTISQMVPKPVSTENISLAALFRVVEMASPTLLIDEVDAFLRNDKDEMRGLLNAGHDRNGTVIRVVGDNLEPRQFKVGCPTVIAGIGSLPSTVEDRSITISLRRRLRTEKIERLRAGKAEHLSNLGRKAARWVEDHQLTLAAADPDMPEKLNDREQDNWRPLIAIADLCGPEPGQRARAAAITISEENMADDESAAAMALADAVALFDKRGADRLRSADIVAHLISLEERPWARWRRGEPMTQNTLARLLRPFGIKPKPLRFLPKPHPPAQGYEAKPVREAKARYVDAAPEPDEEPELEIPF